MTAPGPRSFWKCSVCQRIVPSSQAKCRCGTDRPAAFAPTSSRQSAPEQSGSGRLLFGGGVLALGVAALVASVALLRRTEPPPPAPVPAGRTLAVPPPTAPLPGPTPEAPSVDPSVAAELAALTITGEEPKAASPPAAAGPPSPPGPVQAVEVQKAMPSERPEVGSVWDEARKAGTEEFRKEIKALSGKADEADVAWERYLSGCKTEVTELRTAATVAFVAGDRDWFAIGAARSESSLTTYKPTEACAEAGRFYALFGQVKESMCVAEERARVAAVFPGIRREIRRRYRMDWDGWDRACR